MTIEKSACEYFLFLSKFEYALKKSGYVTADSNSNASPDWNRFKEDMHGKISVDKNDADISVLLKQRPARQTYKDGQLGWSQPQKIGDNDNKALIDACLTIRNNLFHGGKHGDGNAGRNETLIKAATKILNSALDANSDVKQQFIFAEL